MVTDEELGRLALEADPDTPVADDAVSFWDVTGADEPRRTLPSWYMPPPMAGRVVTGWRRRVILLIVLALFLLTAAGLCTTDGYLTVA